MRHLEEMLQLLADQDMPVETGELIDRIESGLTETVPVVALDRSRAMQAQEGSIEKTQRRPARKIWAFVAAVLATAVAIAIPIWMLGNDTPTDVVSEPVGVFDMKTDTLCDWLTASDMNEIIAVAQQRAGTEYAIEEFAAGQCDGRWATPGWWGATEAAPLGVIVDMSATDDQLDRNRFVGHHLLDDMVTYQVRTYQYAWQDGLDGYLRVDGHEDEILYFAFGVNDHDSGTVSSPKYENLGLAIVNELLQQMNWIESGG